MFDLGIQELVVIFVVALLVFGPKRLPELAKNMGKGVAELKKAMFDIRREIDQEVGGVTKLDLENLPTSSDDLKKALEEKAMEAVGYNDMPIPEEPAPGQPGGVQTPRAPEEDDKAGEDAAAQEEPAPDQPDSAQTPRAPEETSGQESGETSAQEPEETSGQESGETSGQEPEETSGQEPEETSAQEPDDPYGGLSAEERVAPEEDEQEHPGESRESNA